MKKLRLYSRAEHARAAVMQPARRRAKFIAGGTNLLDLMKLEIETPDKLVDISRLPLNAIEETDDGGLRDRRARHAIAIWPPTRACATTIRFCRARCSPARRRSSATRRPPAAISCSARVAAISTRPPSPATSASPARAAPRSAASTAIHAILGASEHCIATHPSDMAVAMRALDAVVETLKAGRRQPAHPLADFYRLPGDTPAYRNGPRGGRTDHRCRAAAAAQGRASLSQGP